MILAALMKYPGRLALVLLLCLGAQALHAQDSARVRPPRKLGVLPVPTFGYAPETRWYAGAVALFTLRHWADSLTRTSTAKAELSFTQNRQFVSEVGCNIFSRQERYNVEGVVGWRRFPEFWWGLGNAAPDSARERYDVRRTEADVRATRQVAPDVFVGLRYRLQHLGGLEGEAGGIVEQLPFVGNRGGLASGIGPSLNYDSRRNVLNPRGGTFLHLSTLAFHRWTGSEFNFLRAELDVRHFIPLRKGKDVLALQAYGLWSPGEPPFRLQGLLGSDRELRGYYLGRYRDRHYAAIQAEYRLHIAWRIGMTAFAGVGDVFGPYSQASLSAFKPSAGGGIRFMMDKKDQVNLRLDFGVGRQSTGFYIGFGEAF
jgi:outer membrane protein assembly factor BamA